MAAITVETPIKALFSAFHAANFSNKRQLCADLSNMLSVIPDLEQANSSPHLYYWQKIFLTIDHEYTSPRYLSGNWPIQRLIDLLLDNLDQERFAALFIATRDLIDNHNNHNNHNIGADDSVADALVKISHTRNGEALCHSIIELLRYSSTLTPESSVTDLYEATGNKSLKSLIKRMSVPIASTVATVAV